MEGRGEGPAFPPASHRYLIGWWLEIGPASAGAMGDGALTMTQIADDMEALGILLEPWEAKAIRRMSSAFVSQRYEARKPTCPAPWSDAQPADVQDKVTAQFKAMVSAFASRPNAPPCP